MNTARLGLLCFASASLIGAASAYGQTARDFDRVVTPNTEALINVHTNFTPPAAGGIANCVQTGPVTVVIVSPPKNGRISMRPAPEKNPQCSNTLTGTGIFYTPNPGYVGPDAFSYDRQSNGPGAGVRNVKIEVRP